LVVRLLLAVLVTFRVPEQNLDLHARQRDTASMIGIDPSPPSTPWGLKIVLLQQEARVSDKELSYGTGIHRQTIWALKRDPRRLPRKNNKIAIARFFSERLKRPISVTEIFGPRTTGWPKGVKMGSTPVGTALIRFLLSRHVERLHVKALCSLLENPASSTNKDHQP
jgi:hypothetical protein